MAQLNCNGRVRTYDQSGVTVATIRILIVDDYKDWRRMIRLLLRTRPEWWVLAEASDGLEAIAKAEELKPDLIVLDIGLPKLNGMDVAREVRRISPRTKIVFLSQNTDLGIVGAALGTSASGYVHKTHAQRDLVPAVAAVLQGERFVSSSLEGHPSTASPKGEKVGHHHEVLFYSDETVLLDRVTQFISVALKAGDAAVVVATKAHQDSLLQRLRSEGVDTDSAIKRRAYIPLDAEETVSTYMFGDWPDKVQFLELFTKLIQSASRGLNAEHSRVVIFGEGSAVLWAKGKEGAAIRAEQLCNCLARTYKIEILCAYPSTNFGAKEDQDAFHSICAEHSAISSQ
jgi:DNA-binding NarL/FixJ family response regulator